MRHPVKEMFGAPTQVSRGFICRLRECCEERRTVTGPSGGLICIYMLHISFFKVLLEVIVKCLLLEGAMKSSFALHPLPRAFWGERSMYLQM
jgi:hypothetical protein